MRQKIIELHILNLAVRVILFLLVIGLVSCGTLEISLDQTPEPTSTANSQDSGNVENVATDIVVTPVQTPATKVSWGSLELYVHPKFGYELLIPTGAIIQDQEPEEGTTMFSNGSPDDLPTYLITVKVLPTEDRSSEEIIRIMSSDETGVSDIESLELDYGDLSASVVSYNFGPGTTCPEMRPLIATLVDRGIGYAIEFYSNEADQCDVRNIPEALTIIKSFRPPTTAPVMAMTPTHTPTPITDLVVVFTRDNNAWVWTQSGGERQLTKDGGVDVVLLSEDKQIVAFRRGNGIWAVDIDGSNERQLVNERDLPIPTDIEMADLIIGMTINQLSWIPGTHRLLFNTRLELDGPGLFLSDDLWWVDADNLSFENLFVPGEGGNFVMGPDGQQLALVTPDNISLTTITGENKQQIFNYTPVSTYSELSYYAQPVWSPMSDVLMVVIPPPDRLAQEKQAFGIWRLNLDSTTAALVGTLEIMGRVSLPDPTINPTLDMIAYLSSPEVEPNRTDLLFVPLGDTIGEPTFYTSSVDWFNNWSPGGDAFSFSKPPGEIASISTYTGRLEEEPKLVGTGETVTINLQWIDDDRYLFLQASDKGWDLLLTDSNDTSRTIASIVGQPPSVHAKQ